MSLCGPRIVFHVAGHMAGRDGQDLPGFLKKLHRGFGGLGAETTILPRDLDVLNNLGDTRDLHIVHNGRIRHPAVLNTGLAYIQPFWYLDPAGVFADSSLTEARFDPSLVDPAQAQAFLGRLVHRLRDRRISRYDQPQARQAVPPDCIAVFLQGRSDPVTRARHMPDDRMIETIIAHRDGRPVVIKPHPRTIDPDMITLVDALKGRPGVTISQANIHDILSVAAVSVSVCSAVSLEGLMHDVPAILFGRSDFHHCAETVRDADDWPLALNRALSRSYPFAAFLYWFLGQSMIAAGRDDLMMQVLTRMRHLGLSPARFGLREPR